MFLVYKEIQKLDSKKNQAQPLPHRGDMDHVHNNYGLVFNPLLIAKSKEVMNIIKDIAYEHSFVCNDLILAVLWHSLDTSRKKSETTEKDDAVKYVESESVTDSKDLLGKQPHKCSTIQPLVENFGHSNKSSSPHIQLTDNVISKEGSTSPILNESVSSKKNTNIDLQQHGKNHETSKDCVEVISIDDDLVIVSAEEVSSHTTKTILAENDECSYFEMDCDEIDENDDGDDEADPSSGVSVLCEVNGGGDKDVGCEMFDEQITLNSIGIRRKVPCDKSSKVSTEHVDVITQHKSQSAVPLSSMSISTPTVSVISNKYGTDTLNYSSQSQLVQSVQVESESSPCKKRKRLLDYDKKWHMAPKHSVDQDKYLALPGGIESNSIHTEDEGDEESTPHSPPSVGIELVNADVEKCNKDDLFRDSPTNIDTGLEDEADIDINQSEKEEKCEKRQICKDKNEQKGLNFSDVKKPVVLRSSKRNIRRSQFLQVAKIGRKGFARKKDESLDSKAHDLNSGKSKFGQSGRSHKRPLGKQTRDTTVKSVSLSLAQKASKGKMKSSKNYGRSDKSLKSNEKSSSKITLKPKSNLLDSEDETSSDNEDGFVEEVEWTTKVDEKFSEKEKKIQNKQKNSTRGEKSNKQKETKTVEVLLMDVDDVKLLDDVTSVIDNEHGETSRNERSTDMDENYDSDVIVID